MEWWQILLICIGSLLVLFGLSIVFYKQFFKRFYDIVLSGLALIVLSPLLLILIVVGAIVMRGNPFFTQDRPGKDGKVFKLIKLRSMSNLRGEDGELLSDEKRLTAYGRFLRSTSLDELPELFCILWGSMSIIGPRPLLVEYLPWYTEEERHRHDVRPGLSGWAQVNGRNFLTWEQKFAYDLEYVQKLSFFFDLKIIVTTVLKVLKHSDIAVNTAGSEGNLAKIRREKLEEPNVNISDSKKY